MPQGQVTVRYLGTRGGRIKQSYLYPGWGRGTGQGNTTPDCEH